jgi:hypothetical protein
VATTLTDSGELTYVSFGIEKVESTPDGDLMVYGRATDGSVDHDQQIVHPDFSSKAIAEWLATGGNVRVQHNPQRDPAGIGVEAHTDPDGATWVKALIVEDAAKKLVSKGVLRAYSVGIANPSIERDMTGKARGGIIKSGKIVEISLVDRPANAQCGFQLVKSVDGHAEFTGELFGDEAAIAKALGATVTKDDITDFEVPSDFDINFTPNDLMKIMQDKIVKRHYNELAAKAIADAEAELLGKDHRDFSVDQRRQQASAGHALPDGSYPIPDTDALRRAAILARSGHGNVAEARKLIARRARELGVDNPLDSGDTEKVITSETEPVVEKADEPAITKDPEVGDGDNDADDKPVIPEPHAGAPEAAKASAPPAKGGKKKTGKKLPPWLNKPDADDSTKVAGCAEEHEHTDKCGPLPAPKETQQPETAPLPELHESPAKPHMKGATDVLMRYKTIGMDTDLGMLHDFTCPAYNPNEIAQLFPLAGVDTLIDTDLWQRKALNAATGKSLTEAMEAQQAWQAVSILKATDQGEVNQYRFEAYKAFRDANPGPTSYPTPCEMSPGKFHRPVITDGHSQLSEGYGSPNSSAKVPDTRPNAHGFGRPPLSGGHQSPSPSHMKADFEYPAEQGVPTQIRYAEIEKEKARRALSMLHDHLNHMFPSSCPMLDQDAYRQENVGAHPIAAVGHKEIEVTETGAVLADVYKDIRKLEARVLLGEITEEQAREKLSRKAAKRYAASLHKQVRQGITSIGEVRKALGIEPEPEAVQAPPVTAPDISKAAGASALTPDLMKTMMSEILEPLQVKITALEERNASYEEKIAAQNTEIDSYRQRLTVNDQRWDALANQPDPSTAAFAGLALNNPVTKNAPAGIVKQAEHHERIQGMMIRQLERTWRTSENPAEREAAYNALLRHRGDIPE